MIACCLLMEQTAELKRMEKNVDRRLSRIINHLNMGKNNVHSFKVMKHIYSSDDPTCSVMTIHLF